MRLTFIIGLSCSLFLFGCGESETQFQGYIEGQNLYMESPFSGILQQLPVVRGQTVQKGTLLFQLDPDPQALELKQSEQGWMQAKNTLEDLKKPERLPEIAAIVAQIDQVNAEIELAKVRVERAEKLIVKQAIDKDSRDAAVAHLAEQQQLKTQYQANLDLAKLPSRDDRIKAQAAQVAALAEKIKEAQWNLSQKKGIAPSTGVIFDTFFSVGEFVPVGKPVLALLTPDNIYLVFFLPLSYMPKIHLNQEIQFGCEECNSKNAALIHYISPTAEYLPPLVYSRDNADKLVFRIHAKVKNPSQFKPGQPVIVSLP
jgi:HlyD family secretion protein